MSVNDSTQGGLDKQWYLLKGRDVLGPFAGHVIRDMARDRQVGADAMVALPGSPNWQPISILTGASGLAPQAPAYASATTTYRHYAGFWIRVAAYLLDTLILAIPIFIVSFVLILVFARSGMGDEASLGVNLIANLFSVVVWVIYGAVFNSGAWQATPGKRICNIHIIHESGGRIGVGRAIGRAFAYYLDSLTLMIGFMLAGWTAEKTALHDMICSTRVVYGRPGQAQAQLTAPFE